MDGGDALVEAPDAQSVNEEASGEPAPQAEAQPAAELAEIPVVPSEPAPPTESSAEDGGDPQTKTPE